MALGQRVPDDHSIRLARNDRARLLVTLSFMKGSHLGTLHLLFSVITFRQLGHQPNMAANTASSLA